MNLGRETWKLLERASHHASPDRVFRDWVEICVATLCSLTYNVERGVRDYAKFDGVFEDRYKALIAPYSRGTAPNRPIDFMAHALGAVQMETRAAECDVLGELFMEHVSHGHNGQYFTPTSLCAMMTAMTIGESPEDFQSVSDPACGSGRMLIEAAKINRTFRLHGVDTDRTCCLMAVLNLSILGYRGRIVHGNTLSTDAWTEWEIGFGGFIWERTITREAMVASQKQEPAPRPTVQASLLD